MGMLYLNVTSGEVRKLGIGRVISTNEEVRSGDTPMWEVRARRFVRCCAHTWLFYERRGS